MFEEDHESTLHLDLDQGNYFEDVNDFTSSIIEQNVDDVVEDALDGTAQSSASFESSIDEVEDLDCNDSCSNNEGLNVEEIDRRYGSLL
ncbi:hypothetical protein Tco_0592629 [Tanacetum coccineum]